MASFDSVSDSLPAAGPDREFQSDALEVTALRHRTGSVFHVHDGCQQLQCRRFKQHLFLRFDNDKFAFRLEPGADIRVVVSILRHQHFCGRLDVILIE